ncbi:DUF2188 domain-containing protein [Tuberibacillus sp. Marseille-P3662]|uniref:DUF2188 domain-containing protein n=1 Tax=Tuberibacillus sp. Marseille-P3662 TaxID=1965358 RepID=UPI000A1C7E21|nr:DUF2188 domain-containing protein [Tuberibacillus sp. Marseille-P3662]
MNQYYVVPDKDALGWYVKIEDTAPIELYDKKDKAIDAGVHIAKDHRPSHLSILDSDHNVEEERIYKV